MSSSDLRARMDGLEVLGKADAVYPEPLSRHNRAPFAQQGSVRSGDLECSPHMYKRTVKKKTDRRGRFRTQPVTFMEIKEVDEEKVEDPLTGLSGNSSDLSDSEKSSSMQDLKMKWAGDLTRSLSARRQRSGSRGKLDIPEVTQNDEVVEEEESRDVVMEDVWGPIQLPVKYPRGFARASRPSI